jgi:hypothetical protein
MSVRRPALSTVAVALAAVSFAVPSAALAKGGGGGGGTGGGGATTAPAPPPAVDPVLCDFAADGPQADGGSIFSNQVGDAGCLTVRQSGQSLSVYAIALTPGWTDVITSNGGGTNSRVQVTFTNAATGTSIDARVEFGKTRIG